MKMMKVFRQEVTLNSNPTLPEEVLAWEEELSVDNRESPAELVADNSEEETETDMTTDCLLSISLISCIENIFVYYKTNNMNLLNIRLIYVNFQNKSI